VETLPLERPDHYRPYSGVSLVVGTPHDPKAFFFLVKREVGQLRKWLSTKPAASNATPVTVQTYVTNNASGVKRYREKRNKVAANIKNPIPNA
jgi:hypothetical protein